MKIGYLRVSTEEQCPDRQIDGMTPFCDELHIERCSAVAKERPVFNEILARLSRGDALVVWDVDRAFRSTVDAVRHAEKLRERGIEFRIINLGVDTATADGMLVYTVVAALAEHERKRLSERTKQGIAAARKRGKRIGRPSKLTPCQIRTAQKMFRNGEASMAELAGLNGVHPWTLRRRLNLLEREEHT